jgi:RND family efflux transporter MFP subunit
MLSLNYCSRESSRHTKILAGIPPASSLKPQASVRAAPALIRTVLLLVLLSQVLAASEAAAEPEPIAHTAWGAQAEIFVEFPPLVVGSAARFSVHFTDLRNPERFLAVTAGSATVTLQVEGAQPITASTTAPRVPGIFGVTIVPAMPGPAKLVFSLDGPGAKDSFELTTRVHSTAEEVKPEVENEPPGEKVAFLKEQQWQLPFALALVTRRQLGRSVHALGEVRSKSGKEVRVHPPKPGRLEPASGREWPVLGQRVEAGETLAVVLPPTSPEADRSYLELESRQAAVELSWATQMVERSQRLASQGAIPRQELESARKQLELARSRVETARKRLEYLRSRQEGNGPAGVRQREEYQLRSPIAGTLVAVQATAGENVEEATTVFTVIDLSRVWIVSRVYEPDMEAARAARTASFKFLGEPRAITLESLSGTLVTIGDLVDARTRTLPVVFEVGNPERRLKIGQFVEVELETGNGEESVAIPDGALYDDGGRDVVFLALGGESFLKRRVRVGNRQRGFVQIVEGLQAGDRVVTVGGYEVYLQSVSRAIPEHGHAH